MKDLLESIVGTLVSGAYLAALGLAVFSVNPWFYHPVLFILLLVPGLFAFCFSIKGRIAEPSTRLERMTNTVGTYGFILFGALMLTCYGWVIYSK